MLLLKVLTIRRKSAEKYSQKFKMSSLWHNYMKMNVKSPVTNGNNMVTNGYKMQN